MAHDGQELALGASGGDGLGAGVAEDRGLFRQFGVLLALTRVDGLQKGGGGAHAPIGAVLGDDEAAQQGGRTALQHDVAKGVDADAGLDHGRLGIHGEGDGAEIVKGVAEAGGDLLKEGGAFDQADGAIAIDHGNDQRIRLAFKTRKNLAAESRRRNRLWTLGKGLDGRHTAWNSYSL